MGITQNILKLPAVFCWKRLVKMRDSGYSWPVIDLRIRYI